MTPPKLYGMDPVTQHAPGNANDNAGPATTSSDYRERRHGPPYAARFSITDTGSKKWQSCQSTAIRGVVTFPLRHQKKRQHIKIASRQTASTTPGQEAGMPKINPTDV